MMDGENVGTVGIWSDQGLHYVASFLLSMGWSRENVDVVGSCVEIDKLHRESCHVEIGDNVWYDNVFTITKTMMNEQVDRCYGNFMEIYVCRP